MWFDRVSLWLLSRKFLSTHHFSRPVDFLLLWWHFLSLDSTWISAKTSFWRPFTQEQEQSREDEKKINKEMKGNEFTDRVCGHKRLNTLGDAVSPRTRPWIRSCDVTSPNCMWDGNWEKDRWIDACRTVSPRVEGTGLWTSLLSWINLASERAGGEGGVHGDLNQRILVCLVQTHMVTIGVHGEGYLNTHPPCELYTLL